MKTGYLVQNKKKNLILSPFMNPNQASQWEMLEKVKWVSSGMNASDQMKELDETAFVQIDKGVDKEREETNYYPRLFTTAGVFILVYFVLSFAIRDPIPIIDELLVAGVLTFLTWNYLKKRNNKVEVALKKKLELKARVNEAKFEISPKIAEIETYLDSLENISYLELSDMIIKCHGKDLEKITTVVDKDFLDLLNYYLKTNFSAFYTKRALIKEARADDKEHVKLSAFLVNRAHKKGKDLSILALSIALEEAIIFN